MDILMEGVYWSQGYLWVLEYIVAKLPLGQPFYTRWEVFIPYLELPEFNIEDLEIGPDGSFLRNKKEPFIKEITPKGWSYSFKNKGFIAPPYKKIPFLEWKEGE